ncbi:hypothetical protein EJ07DRAFT_156089 [Lizonia empirigonia]|nr:hypothetical protein EJ07DRAFT_156089 [Lizonia empirigonia]
MSTSNLSTEVLNNHDEDITGAESDNQAFQKLKDLFENHAELLTVGCRDTIDSIISKYETLRNEVQEDPRIALALNAEFDDVFPLNFNNRLRNVVNNSASAQELDAPSGGRIWQVGVENQHFEAAQIRQLLATNAENPQSTAFTTLDDRHSCSIGDSEGHTDGDYHTSDTRHTDVMWEYQEDLLLDRYANMDEGIFNAVNGALLSADSVRTMGTKSATGPNNIREWLLETTSFSFSPIMQVAMVEPFMNRPNYDTAADRQLSLSENGRDNHSAASNEQSVSVSSLAPDLVLSPAHPSVSQSTVSINAKTMQQLLDGLKGLQSRLEEPLVTERDIPSLDQTHTSTIAARAGNEKENAALDGTTVTIKVVTPQIKSLGILSPETTDHLMENYDANHLPKRMRQLPRVTITSPFLTWLEEDKATEFVLATGLGFMLLTVAIAGSVF